MCILDSLNLNTPVVIPPGSAMGGRYVGRGQDNRDILENIEDAIAVATTNLGLISGVAFQARVVQLAQLNVAHKTVCRVLINSKIISSNNFSISFSLYYVNMMMHLAANSIEFRNIYFGVLGIFLG